MNLRGGRNHVKIAMTAIENEKAWHVKSISWLITQKCQGGHSFRQAIVAALVPGTVVESTFSTFGQTFVIHVLTE